MKHAKQFFCVILATLFLFASWSNTAADTIPESYSSVVKKVIPATVVVKVFEVPSRSSEQGMLRQLLPHDSPLRDLFPENPNAYESADETPTPILTASGAGFVFNESGYIFTLNHIIDTENDRRIEVVFKKQKAIPRRCCWL